MPSEITYEKAILSISVTGVTTWYLVMVQIAYNYNVLTGEYSNEEYKEFYFANTYGGFSMKGIYNNGTMNHFEIANSSMTFSMSEGEYYDASNNQLYLVQDFANLVFSAVGLL